MSTVTTLTPVSEQAFGVKIQSRWIEVVSHLDPRYGGLSAVVPPLSAGVGYTGRKIAIAAFCAPGEKFYPPEFAPEQISFWPSSRKAWMLNARLRSAFEQRVRNADGLHVHGLWEQSTTSAARLARRLGKPYVLSAHGMLEPWALSQKRLEKMFYAHLLERANVNGAGCLHALTLAEAKQYRAFGAKGPIAIIPNGVTIPQDATPDHLLEQFPDLVGRRIVLYLGRLHEKKGLDLLLKAWKEVASIYPDAHLVLAGPDSNGTRTRLVVEVIRSGLRRSVLFTGMLNAQSKWSALAAATGFVLPSHSEGLSVGVLEAMGMGVPIIVTKGCNMPEVAEYGAGWIIPSGQASLAESLYSMLGNSTAANHTMGSRGAALVSNRYAWPVVARQMAEVYAWLEGSGPKPQSMPLLDRGEPCQ